MTKLAIASLLCRSALSIMLAAAAGCATVGAPNQEPPATDSAPATVSGALGSSSPGPSEAVERKPEAARVFKGTGALVKAPKPDKEPAGGNTSLNFEAADVRDIAKTVLAEILQESYIVDPKVAGTITFRTTRPLPREALLPTLETVLRMNGIILIKENGIYKIMSAASARGSLSPKMGGPAAGFTIQVVPLKYIGSAEMAKILEGFAPDPGAIKADGLRNLLILAGTQNEIQHMLDTIDMFDVDWLSGMSIGLFTLQSADVKTVDAEFNKILGDKANNPLAGAVRIIPLERLNAFVIISPQPYYLEQAKLWLERLDRVGGTGGTRLYVYHVQNGKAEHLADLLNQTFGGGKGQAARPTTAPGVAPGLSPTEIRSGGTIAAKPATATPGGGSTLSISDDAGTSEVRVVADKENNFLLVLANAAGYDKIEAALKKLDQAPRQVLIEVMIAEVTLSNEFTLGVEWTFTHGPRKSGQLDLGEPGLSKLTPGFSFALANVAGTGIQAVLNMLATDGKVNVLSSPHIMVADNQTAKIQVGDSVPIQGQQTIGINGATYNSVQYLDTGIILSVTPRINAGGLVNLDITQEYSTQGAVNSALANSPTINKRSAKTQMTAQSGETMVLGGMISESSSNKSAGLPFLSAIPVLGGLFGTTDRSTSKTELIVLITPHVANNVGQAKQISDELQRKMGEARDLVGCGTANLLGYTTRGGLWCLQPGRFEGTIDKTNVLDAQGRPVYPPASEMTPAQFATPTQPQFQRSVQAK
jgi:general secretion pathway protein D